jgi:hypothetical protein
MEAWQGNVQRPEKKEVASWVANHLGWEDLRADTRPTERKFNIWYFVDLGAAAAKSKHERRGFATLCRAHREHHSPLRSRAHCY